MKLIVSIISNDDSSSVSSALTEHGFQVTKLSTTGGFLKAGNTTLLTGVDDDKLDEAIEIIREYSRERIELMPTATGFELDRFNAMPVEVQVGGATIFVLDIERFIKI